MSDSALLAAAHEPLKAHRWLILFTWTKSALVCSSKALTKTRECRSVSRDSFFTSRNIKLFNMVRSHVSNFVTRLESSRFPPQRQKVTLPWSLSTQCVIFQCWAASVSPRVLSFSWCQGDTQRSTCRCLFPTDTRVIFTPSTQGNCKCTCAHLCGRCGQAHCWHAAVLWHQKTFVLLTDKNHVWSLMHIKILDFILIKTNFGAADNCISASLISWLHIQIQSTGWNIITYR